MGFLSNYAWNLLSVALRQQPVRPLLFSYYVTHRCNLSCRYCCDGDGKRFKEDPIPELPVSDAKKLISILRSAADTLDITGGEPLIRRGVVKIVREIAALPGVRTVSLTTNGIRLARYAEVLKAEGLSRVNVSLDSLNPGTYRQMTRGGDLATALHGVDAALAAGLSVKINVVLFDELNIQELEAFAAFAIQKKVEEFYLM